MRSDLTLNLGLRFDRGFPATESHNRAVNGFDTINAAASAAYAQRPSGLLPASQFAARGGLTFANDANRNIYDSRSYNFSPRIGLTWTPGGSGGRTARLQRWTIQSGKKFCVDMLAVDTNVIVRILVGDDVAQTAAAGALLDSENGSS